MDTHRSVYRSVHIVKERTVSSFESLRPQEASIITRHLYYEVSIIRGSTVNDEDNKITLAKQKQNEKIEIHYSQQFTGIPIK